MLILTPGSEPYITHHQVSIHTSNKFDPTEQFQTYRVGSRKADGRRGLGPGSTDDIELGTLLVELGTGVASGTVEGNHLSAQEILARSNALGDLDGMAALSVDDALSAPDTITSKPVLLDLEPSTTDTRVCGSVVDLLEVGGSGALV